MFHKNELCIFSTIFIDFTNGVKLKYHCSSLSRYPLKPVSLSSLKIEVGDRRPFNIHKINKTMSNISNT